MEFVASQPSDNDPALPLENNEVANTPATNAMISTPGFIAGIPWDKMIKDGSIT